MRDDDNAYDYGTPKKNKDDSPQTVIDALRLRHKNDSALGACQSCNSCMIQVGSVFIATERHSFILYTFYKGNKKVTNFYRFGPTTGNPYKNDPNSTSFYHTQGKTPNLKSLAWGKLVGTWGPFQGSHEEKAWEKADEPLVIVAEGPEFCHYHERFVQAMKRIINSGYSYFPIVGPNCNSGVNSVLRATGLTPKWPRGSYPAKNYYIPPSD